MDEILERLELINNRKIIIYAFGNYPVKARTKVQDVFKWQNDGTAKISPARFVERAAQQHGNWSRLLEQMGRSIVFVGTNARTTMRETGNRIAADVMQVIDRIDTGRLKRSIKAEVR